MRRTIPINDISGVGAGQKATVRIVDTLAYHGILLQLTNITAAQVSNVRVFLNDKEAMSMTGADLDSMNQYFDLAAVGADGLMYIPFTGPGLLDQAEEEGTAVHVGVPYKDGTVIRSMRTELDLSGAVVNPGIKAYGIVREAQAGRNPWFPFVRAATIDVQSGGIKTLSDVVDTKSNREAFCTQVFFKTAQLTNLLVQRNGLDMFDRSKVVNERLQFNGVRKPQAGFFVFDTRENGYGNVPDALAAGSANTLIWKLTMGAAATFPAYVWTIGPLN